MMSRRGLGWIAIVGSLACALPTLAQTDATEPFPPPAQTDATPPPPPTPSWRGSLLPDSWKRQLPASPALRTPNEITYDGEVQRVTVKETIAIALENNPGIAARRLEPTLQEQGILGAQSKFDPDFRSEINYAQNETPNANILAGALSTRANERYANFHLGKLLRPTGTQFSVDFLNDRNDTNSSFNILRPNYSPQLGLSVLQPLLRDFGLDFQYLVVRVAERTADAALKQYEANLADFVAEVIVAYWNVVRTRENLEVQREFKSLADRTVTENEARVRVGLLAPVAVLEAQADAALREEQVVTAENDYTVARQQLAKLAYYSPRGTVIPRILEPVEDAAPEDVEVDREDALKAALAERPEVKASADRVQARQLNERIAGNGLLPRVDAVGSLGYNGLAGSSRCITFSGQTVCDSPFSGSRADAYGNLTDFRSYAFGLRVLVPIANAAAESEYTQTRISREQAELDHRDLLSQVALEVYQSASDVVSGRKRIETSGVAVKLAEENLRNQQKRQEVGMATTKDLLDFQTRLRNARAAQVQARIDYAIAVARWERAQGSLLQTYQIVVTQPGKRSPPWFARF